MLVFVFHEESDPTYVVAKLLQSLHQRTTFAFPHIITVLGSVPVPAVIVTQVPVHISVFLHHDCPQPCLAGVNSHNYLPGTIANIYCLQCGCVAQCHLHDCGRLVFLCLLLKLDVLLHDLGREGSNLYVLEDTYCIVCT